ncbi:MAG: alanine--tRNA ligase [Thermoanaerobacterales bacterium]|nr:alanine--tRNA ligase [Thermoanaerobacterales bacterium]
MRGSDIRRQFLDFFAARGHRVLPSASLIPANDPSLLWTAAGMVPFKPYFTGAATPHFRRAVTCQKCLRTPDIEQVGRTARHHTFFEMLGNFSFGDYFKEKAIPWAWEFVTRELGLDPGRLWISIYLDDDEAFEHWRGEGVPPERIVRLGKDTNFWEIGVGPCGPCSEIYYDLGPERGCGNPQCAPGCDCDRYLEIWNLVFIQFFRNEQGEYHPLERRGIDTGMGLERVASVLQKVPTNFDTDLFREVMDHTAALLGVRYGSEENVDLALKVIADHGRAVTFAIGDGVLPSNEGRGYVIRRLLRRAARLGFLLGRRTAFLHEVAGAVIAQMASAYPELKRLSDHIRRVIRHEEERFSQTLTVGIEILGREIESVRARGGTVLDGETAFRLYDTYGFPLELTREIVAEQGLAVDESGFRTAMEAQRERARAARGQSEYISERGAFYRDLRDELGETRFVGYTELESVCRVAAILADDRRAPAAGPGETVEAVFDVTPCYAEGGGQVADHAVVMDASGLKARVTEVVRPVDGLFLHRVEITEGNLREGQTVKVAVDAVRRRAVCRNHTATHLLHRALKDVLGEHANQAGSLVAPDRLRFDFTHYQAPTAEELARVEKEVNAAVFNDLPVDAFTTSYEHARELGATALFGEKYGDTVRVVRVGDFSMELCGGTHVPSTGTIGLFKITGEGSVGAGLRRIEALTGEAALAHLLQREVQVEAISRALKAAPEQVVDRVEGLVRTVKSLERENEHLRDRVAATEVLDILGQAREHNGVKVLVTRVRPREMAELRGLVDVLRDRLGPAVIVLGAATGERVNLVAAVDRGLTARGLHAGQIVKEAAAIVGGGGGGRPEMAQAGGKEPVRLNEALERARTAVLRSLRSQATAEEGR